MRRIIRNTRDELGFTAGPHTLGRLPAAIDQEDKQAVDVGIGKPNSLSSVCPTHRTPPGALATINVGAADMGGQLPQLGLVQLADEIDGRGQIAKLCAATQQQIGLVARAHDQTLESRGLV